MWVRILLAAFGVTTCLALSGCDSGDATATCHVDIQLLSSQGDPIDGGEILVRLPDETSLPPAYVATTRSMQGSASVELPTDTALVLKVVAEGHLVPTLPVIIAPPVAEASVTIELPGIDGEEIDHVQRWSPPLEHLSPLAAIYASSTRALRSWRAEITSHLDERTGKAVLPGISRELLNAQAELDERMATTSDPRVRRFAAVMRWWLEVRSGFYEQITADTARRILQSAPPDAPEWGFYPNGPVMALGRIHEPITTNQRQFRGALEACAAGNPDRRVQAEAIAGLVFHAVVNGDMAEAERLYDRLEIEYGGDYNLEVLHTVFDPDREVEAGQPAPHFATTLLDGTGVTDEDFLGRWVLLHFWATWCGPCKAEMPQLHDAHEEFQEHGLVILSLAVNDTPQRIARFRSEQWEMPWQHAALENGFDSGPTRQFKVVGVPHYVLINPQGEMVATGIQLRGERLIAELDDHLSRPRAG